MCVPFITIALSFNALNVVSRLSRDVLKKKVEKKIHF